MFTPAVSPTLRLLRGARRTWSRTAWGMLATIGCVVGVLRGLRPPHVNRAAQAFSTVVAQPQAAPAGDSSNLSVDEARSPRSGLRRAAVVVGQGLTEAVNDGARDDPGNTRRPDAELRIPRSFVPAPPFHPPRRTS